ncbi:aminotransferase class I/II-fold pyridoxal phosphate-dependent enzyme [Adhaeribacter aquaticus]|uniref:aminotransferase class I/II-fold pyridoxal phosphate-dependent enzyme n=1 Tax=Adhaeribacter aquaticus TaxID=299567 RepID=UPI00047B835F|nr:8-amino-7-oxononanoate synthase [Adhaeribacter aquaticus]
MELPLNLQRKLTERQNQGILRQLKTTAHTIDFCSNDYLGLARSEALKKAVEGELTRYAEVPAGATGSRLLSGNFAYTEELESFLAQFHQAEAALLFNSGFVANTGFFSAVPQRGDTILYDDTSHASMKDGIRLSFAKAYSFRHNSLDDLRAKFTHATGNVYVAVESLYSMDGDYAPLVEIAEICQEKGAYLVVDEAHSNGLFGQNGEGLVQELNLQDRVFARVMTFGKALGCHGAVIVGSAALKQFLVNFSRPFIYTTALPLHAVLTIKCAYQLLPSLHTERVKVKHLSNYLKSCIAPFPEFTINPEDSPIHAVQTKSIAQLKNIANQAQKAGFDVRPVFSPTVPEGKERLRIIVHAYNSEAEIDKLAQTIADTL